MRLIRLVSMLLAFFVLTTTVKAEDELTLAAGAGYKRLVEQLCTTYTAQSGLRVQQIFGNMGQVTAQAKESGAIDFLLGDKSYLDTTDLAFSGEYVIGKGKLIAAVAKGSSIKSLDELAGQAVTRIAIADSKKAIFGHAATEFLKHKGLWDQVQSKLLVVGTVPQVTAYVISGEVDIGFINLTEAMAVEQKVGLLLPVDESLYSPILMVAKRMQQSRNTKAANAFLAFLQTDEARSIIKKNGLE
ncbi:MAG: molybdate ABC transporter substrate-binding protein [Desulfobulbaceae bacterium]|jgi:molybdate transport system substrate-binding protein|nr:molybdate ABC transporter substrate-binding protein [Desulfobulbaceae bacterium]